jgi:hypothetical protein
MRQDLDRRSSAVERGDERLESWDWWSRAFELHCQGAELRQSGRDRGMAERTREATKRKRRRQWRDTERSLALGP